MQRLIAAFGAVALCVVASGASAQNYSTGGVGTYSTCGTGPDLGLAVPEASQFAAWYNLAGIPNVTHWTDNNVWNTDFTDGPGKDMDGSGGSDLPNVYFFTGHGSCQNPPTATDPDFLVTCSGGNVGVTDIGAVSRWGNAGGRLQFAFIDASCPMDLVSIDHNWFPPFQGLHIATGHSGNANHDTLDSAERGNDFSVRSIGISTSFAGVTIPIIPDEAATWAWMDTGLTDVQDQVCAVAVANDSTRDAVIARRDNEHVRPAWGKPSGNWYGWRWVCE